MLTLKEKHRLANMLVMKKLNSAELAFADLPEINEITEDDTEETIDEKVNDRIENAKLLSATVDKNHLDNLDDSFEIKIEI